MTSDTSLTSLTTSSNTVDDVLNPDREKHSIHWFRKGLRIHDNPALLEAVKGATTFRCIYILDPWFAGATNVATNKWRFLLQSLEDLEQSLRSLGTRLYVIKGQPMQVLSKLYEEWNITHLTFEEDPEPHGKEKDKRVKQHASERNVKIVIKTSHTLYNLDEIFAKNGGSAPLTYKRFQTIAAAIAPPVTPVETLSKELIGNAKSPFGDDHDENYGVPTLVELDFDPSHHGDTYKGGESVALCRMDRHLERKAWVASFERPKMTTQSLFANQYCVSPYLRFGCLSPRLFYWKLTELYKKVKNGKPPITLYGQLLWREFFYVAATRNPHFDRMKGNDICIKIPWDENPKALAKWAEGMTGFPWIDAIMAQLKKEGWIHHLARHAIGCFLTRGNLWLSWEEGMKVFDEYMLDADWSVNAGSWMWMSCSSFFQQFFHCYCPVGFGRRCDPNGDFVRHYLPILKGYPAKYIFEPWTAPMDVQRAARCIIGKNYPPPMCNHAEVARINMERMKLVYQQISRCSRVSLLLNTKGEKDKKEDSERPRHGPSAESAAGQGFSNFKTPFSRATSVSSLPCHSLTTLPAQLPLQTLPGQLPLQTLPGQLPLLLVSSREGAFPASSVTAVQTVSATQIVARQTALLISQQLQPDHQLLQQQQQLQHQQQHQYPLLQQQHPLLQQQYPLQHQQNPLQHQQCYPHYPTTMTTAVSQHSSSSTPHSASSSPSSSSPIDPSIEAGEVAREKGKGKGKNSATKSSPTPTPTVGTNTTTTTTTRKKPVTGDTVEDTMLAVETLISLSNSVPEDEEEEEV